MTQEKSTARNSGQQPEERSDKAKQQDQGAGRARQPGEERKGERPIADVDRKVRGGDA